MRDNYWQDIIKERDQNTFYKCPLLTSLRREWLQADALPRDHGRLSDPLQLHFFQLEALGKFSSRVKAGMKHVSLGDSEKYGN